MVDYRVTPEFVDVYESLPDDLVAVVDDIVARLFTAHTTLWARRDRIIGETGGAWVIDFHTRDVGLTLYWDYGDHRMILLILLLARRSPTER